MAEPRNGCRHDTHLSVQQEYPSVFCKMPFADTLWQGKVKEKRFTSLCVGLYNGAPYVLRCEAARESGPACRVRHCGALGLALCHAALRRASAPQSFLLVTIARAGTVSI